jgi:tetratricopeptide (TPR) repeat protein
MPVPDPLATQTAGHSTAAPDGPGGTPAGVAAGDRYALGDEIARGGVGVVYRATDAAFGREVAVKVLLDRYAPTSGTARRFHDEARITGQLQHPNIPAAHDLGTLPDGRPFLAMKLIKGDTLDELLKASPVPAGVHLPQSRRRDTLDELLKASPDRGRLVAAFEKVCEAVAYAHAHGVIHRDLKPANVMVGAFGEVQVMDWGLAKILGERPRVSGPSDDPDETAATTALRSTRDSEELLTQAGSVLGTPAYMPPEQALGAVHEIDVRSDVFGLGGILARHARLIATAADTLMAYTDGLDGDDVVIRLLAALREFGLDVVGGPNEETARQVAGSRLRDTLLGILLELETNARNWGPRSVHPAVVGVIRSSRMLRGGKYARWQDLLDRKDVTGLVAFSGTAEALTFRSGLINALSRDLSRAEQFDAWLALLRVASDRYPHDIWLHFDVREACLCMSPPAYAEDLRHMSAGVQLRPQHVWGLRRLAELYRNLGSEEQAKAADQRADLLDASSASARKAIARQPGGAAGGQSQKPDSPDASDSKGNYRQAELLVGQRKWDEAIQACDQAIALDPTLAEAHVLRGYALRGRGDLDAAIAAYRNALAIRDFGWPHRELGMALERKGEFAEAAAALREAIRCSPTNANYHNDLARCWAN